MTRAHTDLLPPMKWNAWGDPRAAKPLSDGIRGLLKQALGIDGPADPELAADHVRLRPSALRDADRDALQAVLGAEHVRTDHQSRLLRAGGKSTPDLLRRKSTGEQDAPDAVLLPADEAAVIEVLKVCSERAIAVVPFGGGTSVVGGLDPDRGEFAAVVSVDLRRLDALHHLDPISGEAELGAGVTGPQAEELLGAQGFSLGHFPQSFQFATIGGFAATRSSGQDSAGYGRFDDMVRGLTVATPAGVLDLGRAPASAAGPDLRQLIVGSEGVFGIITRVRVRVHPVPETTRYEAWSFPDFGTGAAALRAGAEGEAEAEKLRAEAARVRFEVEAAGQRAVNEAANLLSNEQVSLQTKLALLKVLPDLIREAAKPMEAIDSIRIVQVDGLGAGGSGGSAATPGDANLADSAVAAALRYRAQAPVIDGLMKELGFEGGTLDALVKGAAKGE